jgi:tRNA (mo5U34)-methyltransferase
VNLSPPRLPANAQEIIDRRTQFAERLAEAKIEPLPLQLSWYPYDSIASIDHMVPFFQRHFSDFERAFHSGPLIDIGGGDGDISLFFASLGCKVAAADNPRHNHNWMAGVRALRERLDLPVEIHELDADTATQLPGGTYGLAIFLGVLYHLKNPYLALKTLANQSRYCVLSTRVADVTKSGVPIKDEPVAYLLDHRETNNDPTNQWIFSPAGLERIVKRSGWRIIDELTRGCTESSNPVDLDKMPESLCSCAAVGFRLPQRFVYWRDGPR